MSEFVCIYSRLKIILYRIDPYFYKYSDPAEERANTLKRKLDACMTFFVNLRLLIYLSCIFRAGKNGNDFASFAQHDQRKKKEGAGPFIILLLCFGIVIDLMSGSIADW